MTHTSGPWRIAGSATIRAGKNDWIGTIHWRNRDANARLIAAAPDLFAACRDAYGILVGDPDAEAIIQVLRAAISKAEGHDPC